MTATAAILLEQAKAECLGPIHLGPNDFSRRAAMLSRDPEMTAQELEDVQKAIDAENTRRSKMLHRAMTERFIVADNGWAE